MRLWIAVGSFSALVAVALGAFGTHGLRGTVAAGDLATFETAARYHLFHALAMLAAGIVAGLGPAGGRLAWSAGLAFLIGTVLFSGSLYGLAITGSRALGFITPFGGLGFIIGWLLLAVAGMRLPPR